MGEAKARWGQRERERERKGCGTRDGDISVVVKSATLNPYELYSRGSSTVERGEPRDGAFHLPRCIVDAPILYVHP